MGGSRLQDLDQSEDANDRVDEAEIFFGHLAHQF